MARHPGKSEVALRSIDELAAWQLATTDIDRLLATTDDPRLRALFGDDYEPLRNLSRQASRTARSSAHHVLLVPGILGSTLGTPGNLFTRDTIWFDPVSLRKGDISRLRLPPSGKSSVVSLDVVPTVHAFLRLRLRMLGLTVDYFHYDWRQSLTVIGRQLASHVAKLGGRVSLIGHSMGGLVCRAALKAGMPEVNRIIMLGTPNQGSFASVQVLQGINATVVLVDKLDPHHDAQELTRSVFSTFPSVYELLPRPEAFTRIDLFHPDSWPGAGFRPPVSRLKDAQKTWSRLADQDPRLCLIAGYNQSTVSDLTSQNQQFIYHTTTDGDGTVPLTMCRLPGVPTWYVEESHTGLLRNETVAKAVADLIASGVTDRLPQTVPLQTARNVDRQFVEADFPDNRARPRLLGSRTGAAISPDEIPVLLESAVSLSSLPAESAVAEVRTRRAEGNPPGGHMTGPDLPPPSDRLTSDIRFCQTVISHDHLAHLDLELLQGNIFDVPYRAIVLGIFSNVDPAGPARTLDVLMNGAVTELRARRMFDAAAGKVFVMPVGRNALKADYVVFAGLGEYSQFSVNPESVVQTLSCNVLRTLIHCGVDEFATLMVGSSSGLSTRSSVECLVRGFLDALQATNTGSDAVPFRRVALCERQLDRYAELKDEVYRLGGTDLCRNIRLRLHEATWPAYAALLEQSLQDRVERLQDRQPPRVVYLTARMERLEQSGDADEMETWTLHIALLGAGRKATIFCSARQVRRTVLDQLLSQLPQGTTPFSQDDLLQIGTELNELIFTAEFLQVMQHDLTPQDHLAVIVDAGASRIPWEILPLLASTDPAASIKSLCCVNGGVSRRVLTDGRQSLAKYLEERQRNEILRVLLIINPTGDLNGAEQEGGVLERALSELNHVQFDTLRRNAATREHILQRLRSGQYDVVHFAGHAFFDPINRSRSGLICAGSIPGEALAVLSGADLALLPHLPSLVFFNACESGRIRSFQVPPGTVEGMTDSVRKYKALAVVWAVEQD